MKTKTNTGRDPEVFRNIDGIAVVLHPSGLGNITISRDKKHCGFLRARWDRKLKSYISWSGGNGHQTIADVESWALSMRRAAAIAKLLDRRSPDRMTKSDILGALI